MAIIYHIDHVVGISYVVFDGLVTGDEYIAHTRRLVADAEWPGERKRHLTDLTTMSNPELIADPTVSEMASLWGTERERFKGLKIAIVANKAFAKARRFELAISPYGPSVIVFNLLSTACAWLGVDTRTTAHTLKTMRLKAQSAPE